MRFNDFKNTLDTFTFDNPLRITDGGGGGVAVDKNPVFGGTSLPPDNKAVTESVGGAFELGETLGA